MSMPQTNWGLGHLVIRNPIASICVVVAGAGGFVYNADGSRQPMVSITFDDATYSQFEHGLPMMMERDLPGTLYIATGLLDNEPGDEPFYMSDQDVMAFRDAGWELGGHTIDHDYITEMDVGTLVHNLAEPQRYIAENYGVLATSFSSPYGEFDEQALDMIPYFYANHVNAWSIRNGLNFEHDEFDPFNIHRLDITEDIDVEDVCETVRTLPDDTWFVVIFHQIIDVEETPDHQFTIWDNTTDRVEYVLDCIEAERDAGSITVNTVTEAAIEMTGDDSIPGLAVAVE